MSPEKGASTLETHSKNSKRLRRLSAVAIVSGVVPISTSPADTSIATRPTMPGFLP